MSSFVLSIISFAYAVAWIVFFCVRLEFEACEEARVWWWRGIALESVFAVTAAVNCIATLS
jgi:hypothetical protein